MMSRVAGRWHWIQILTVLAASLVGAVMSGKSQEPVTPPKPATLKATITFDLSAESTFHLNNDSTLKRWLKDGRSRIDAGQITEGLTIWQRILDRGDDGFVRLQSNGPWLEVRHEVLSGITELPPNGQATYERMFGTAARQLFEQSQQTGRPIFATEVMRRYFHTAAGYEAARWLATRWLDKGETRIAARLFERLVSEPTHQARVTPNLFVQAAAAQRLAGNETRARELLAMLGETKIRIAGEERSATQLAARREDAGPKAVDKVSREWLAARREFFGSIRHTRVAGEPGRTQR